MYLVHECDALGLTALHWCAKKNYFKMAQLLMEHKADPNRADFFKRTPLFIASQNGCLKIVKLLLKSHAIPNKKNFADKSCLDI